MKIHDLKKWSPVAIGELLEYARGDAASKYEFAFIANGPIEVWVTTVDGNKLLGWYPNGSGEVSFTASGPVALNFIASDGDADTAVFVRTPQTQQAMRKQGQEVYTSLEPMRATTDFDRLMHLFTQNSRRMQDQLDQQTERLERRERRLDRRAKRREASEPEVIEGAQNPSPETPQPETPQGDGGSE